MKFLANENIERPIVDQLRLKGFEVKYLLELRPRLSDDEVIKMAKEDDLILITNDK